MKHIHTRILEYLSSQNTAFSPISDKKPFDYIRDRRYSPEIGQEHTREFTGKNGKRYYISQEVGNPIFHVYDADLLDSTVNVKNLPDENPRIARAIFDDSKGEHITGIRDTISINVEKEHRRNGVASAIIDFAEERTGKKYGKSVFR